MKRKLYSLIIATAMICLSGVLSGIAFAAEAPELQATYKIDASQMALITLGARMVAPADTSVSSTIWPG